jgi:hypothetical protein
VDAGDVVATVFTRIADGSEAGGSVTVNVAPNANVMVWQILRYTKAAGKIWDVALTNGSDNTSGTAWSVTCGSDPVIVVNDMVVAVSICNTDTPTRTAEAVSATGVTFGAATERNDGGNGLGDDIGFWISDHPASAGGSSAPPVYTSTSSGNIAGATVLVRLREVDPGAVTIVGVGTADSGGFGVMSGGSGPSPGAVASTQGVAMGRSSLRRIGKMAPVRTGQTVIDRAQDQILAKLNQLLEHPLVEAVPIAVTLQPGLNKVGHGMKRQVTRFLWSSDLDGAVISSRQADNPHPDRDIWVWLEGSASAQATLLLIPGI